MLVLKFAEMKHQLDTERERQPGGPRTSLVDLVSKYTEVERLSAPAPESHGTTVTLQALSPDHVAKLSEKEAVQNYLLSNLPVDFDDAFPHATKLRKQLTDHVPGYHSVRVTLQLPNKSTEYVQRYSRSKDNPFKLFDPECTMLRDDAGNPISYVWACLNKAGRESIDQKNIGGASYAGLIYKMKGFSIGDRTRPRTAFDVRLHLYPWFTGEIYIIDPKIVPNAERNDFESSSSKELLQAKLQKFVAEKLIPEAVRFSDTSRAEEKVREYREIVERLERDLRRDPIQLTPEQKQKTLRLLLNMREDLPKRRTKLPPGDRGSVTDLLHRANKVYEKLEKHIEHPEAVIKRRRKAKSLASSPGTSSSLGTYSSPATTEASVRSILDLRSVFQDAGLTLGDDATRIIEIVQLAMDDLLTPETSERFLTYIREKMVENEDSV